MADDGEKWSRLPEEIVQNIFSRLSAYDVVRVGCTCTHLRAFISSHRLTFSPCFSLFVLVYPFDIPCPDTEFYDTAAWVYDCNPNVWRQLPLGFLEHDLPLSPHFVASAGGLLCFGVMSEFTVCNPITRRRRRLPDRPLRVDNDNGQSFELTFDEDSMQAFGLIYDSISGSYDFFVLYHSVLQWEKESRMMHYSSSLSQWKVLPPLVAGEASELHSDMITPCNSGLYTLLEKEGSIVVFAYSNGAWAEIDSPDCSSTLLKAFLVAVHGDLHMVGGVGSVWLRDDVWERPTSICIWKLDVKSMEWVEVTRMPAWVLQEFRRFIDFDDMQCGGKDGVMYMKSLRSDVLMCDLGRSEWKWLKGLDLDVDLTGLIFEPSLSASP